jgi:signal transduction histidine kinase
MFLYLFPDGRFVPGWTRWTLLLWIGRTVIGSIMELLSPRFSHGFWERFIDPTLIILTMITAIYAMIFRYRHDAGPIQRQQIKWVIIALTIVGFFEIGLDILMSLWQPGLFEVLLDLVYFPIYYLGILFAGVCIGISITRHQLWNIDFLINRTLVYSLLTAAVVSLYVFVVGILGTTVQGRSNLLVSILATGLVAVLVQPLRDRLQRGVNRLMYGDRDDPVTVLSRLGERLEATIAPDAVLPALVETVAQTLKLPYAAITCGAGVHGNIAAAYGEPTEHLVQLPLLYRGEIIGQLVVSLRAPDEKFNPADDHLLKNIAHQAGMAVHAVSLTADLQLSRQRLVMAREEERRRLRRDLHDGLGPTLASQGLKLAAVKQLLEHDPSSAVALLDQVMAQNQSTVEEVRHLVYGLRPPALDELGLVPAIRDYVFGMDGKSTLQIQITEPEAGLPPLSAAVEVAAYRIVLEALTNVIRHAQAKHCQIQFVLNTKDNHRALEVEIRDDGIGLPRARRSGVGTRAMRERAEEVGGTFMMESLVNGGTRVSVWIPLMSL